MMIPHEVLTCTSRAPLLPTVLQCDPVNIAANVPSPPTDWGPVLATALVGLLAALLGSMTGAWMAIRHSKKIRIVDEERHLKERVAELVYRLDNVRRVASDYFDNPACPRNGQGMSEIRVHNPPESVLQHAHEALTSVSEVLGYLALIAPENVSDQAKLAATSAASLTDVLESEGGFMESDYRKKLNSFDVARTELYRMAAGLRTS